MEGLLREWIHAVRKSLVWTEREQNLTNYSISQSKLEKCYTPWENHNADLTSQSYFKRIVCINVNYILTLEINLIVNLAYKLISLYVLILNQNNVIVLIQGHNIFKNIGISLVRNKFHKPCKGGGSATFCIFSL